MGVAVLHNRWLAVSFLLTVCAFGSWAATTQGRGGAAASGIASAKRSRHPAYCVGLASSRSLGQLSSMVAAAGDGRLDPGSRTLLRRAGRVLAAAARRARGRTRAEFAAAASPVLHAARVGRFTSRTLALLGRRFRILASDGASACGLPPRWLFQLPKEAAHAASASRPALSVYPTIGPVLGRAASGTDITLCSAKNDGRVSIPHDLVVDACFDGATLFLKNRGVLPRYIASSGSVGGPSRVPVMPPGAASMITAVIYPSPAVLAPGYEVAMAVGPGTGGISATPAATTILDVYGVSKVLFGYAPLKNLAVLNAAAEMVKMVEGEVATARNCLNGANLLKQVWCSARFVASSTGSIATFVAQAGLDALKEGPKALVSRLWGLLQEGMFVADVAGDVFAPGATQISVGAAASPPQHLGGPPPPDGSGGGSGTTPQPPPPTPLPPPPPTLWSEQETPNHPVNTFTNYHNASGMGPAIAAGQWVQVSCKVYDPTIGSVNPDGYWYRIASAPWSNAYYSPANTFMNGDPYGGPYTHNTDFAVANC